MLIVNKELLVIINSIVIHLAIVYLSQYDVLLSVVLSVIYVYFFVSYIKINITTKVVFFFVFLFSIIFNYMNFTPISGVDEYAFYHNVKGNSFSDLVNLEIEKQQTELGFISSRVTYSALLNLLLPFSHGDFDPRVIFCVNSLFWFFSSTFYIGAITKEKYSFNNQAALIFLYASLSISYWLGNFGKDVVTISICMISASLLIRKKYTFSFAFLIVAMFFRPYSFVMVAAYSLPFFCGGRFSGKYIASVFIMFLLITKVSMTSLANSLIGFIYLFVSPNPLSLNNWSLISTNSTWQFSPLMMTIEGVFLSFVLVSAIYLILLKEDKYKDKLALKIILSIYSLSLVLIVVGMSNLDHNGLQNSVGSLGDNFVRKKLIVWPLIAVLVGIVVDKIRWKISK